MKEYIEKSDVDGLVQMGWSGDAIVTAIINNGVSSFPAIPIPEGATNGDLLLVLLAGQHDKIRPVGNTQMGITLDCEWWNAPYKKEREE